MSADCNTKNPLAHGGTSQAERIQAALDPSYVQVDERSTEDLLAFASKFATEINYFDLDNTVDDDWKEFIENDLSTIVSLISLEDVKKTVKDFEVIYQGLKKDIQSGSTDAYVKLRAAFDFILEEARKVSTWYNGTTKDSLLNSLVRSQIETLLKQTRFRLAKYEEEADNWSSSAFVYDGLRYAGWNPIWAFDTPPTDPQKIFEVGNSDKEQFLFAIGIIKKEFEKFTRAQLLIKNQAPTTLEKTLNEWPEHEPHMGLFLSFLELFKHAQNEANTLTKRHLDFYYQEVLRLTKKEQVSDQVHVIFELAKNINGHLIEAGTLLNAGTDESGEDIIFEVENDTVLNQGKVKEVKSVFADLVESNNNFVQSLYAAKGANTVNGKGEEPVEDGKFWKLFGKTQEGLSEEERTMDYAKLGFAFSSPIFFLNEGRREITVKLIVSKFYNQELNEIPNLNTLEADLRYSIDVQYSGKEGWVNTNLAAVDISVINNPDPKGDDDVEIFFTIALQPDEEPVVGFDSKIIDEEFNTEWPVVKFVFQGNDLSADGFGIKEFVKAKWDDNQVCISEQVTFLKDEFCLHRGVIYQAKKDVDGYCLIFNHEDWIEFKSVEDYVFARKNNASINEFKSHKEGGYKVGQIVYLADRYYVATNDLPLVVDEFGSFTTVPPTPNEIGSGAVWKRIDRRAFAYGWLKNLTIQTILLDVAANGVSSLILGSGNSSIDPNKKILPWSNTPEVESNFYLGSQEIFSKQLYSFEMNIDWDGLPETSFRDHYKAMHKKMTPGADGSDAGTEPDSYFLFSQITNYSFRANLEILDEGEWKPLVENLNLFDTMTDAEKIGTEDPDFTYHPAYSSALNLQSALFQDSLDDSEERPAAYNPPKPKKVIGVYDPKFSQIEKEPNDTTIDLGAVERNENLKKFTRFQHKMGKGFVRLVLKRTFNNIPKYSSKITGKEIAAYNSKKLYGPADIKTFGQQEFAPLTVERILNKTNGDSSDPYLITELPLTPYTPTIKKLTVNYRSNVTIDLTNDREDKFLEREDKFYHVQPFGLNEVHRRLIDFGNIPYGSEPVNIKLLPDYSMQGYTFVGLEKFKAPGNISILFQFANGTNNPDVSLPDVEWQYLEDNNWKPFPLGAISFDATNELVNSGIINFAFPRTFNNDNTLMPSGLHWLRGKIRTGVEALNSAVAVKAQALSGKFLDKNNDPKRLANVVAAETISSLKNSDSAVIRLEQPFASFGGKMEEDDQFYYTRVSERLRHKNRAVNIKDYETLVLEQFPKIFRVKCLNHTKTRVGFFDDDEIIEALDHVRESDKFRDSSDTMRSQLLGIEKINLLLGTEMEEGNVTLVMIPRIEDVNIQDKFEPRIDIGTLEAVRNYIQAKTSIWVNVATENPLYEKIVLNFKAIFKEGYDKSFYAKKLNEELIEYLTPWSGESGGEIVFGGKVRKSAIIDFIDERGYVDFVHDFKMFQKIEIDGNVIIDKNIDPVTGEIRGLEEAFARTSRSIVSTVDKHEITAIAKHEITALGGINYMIEEASLIVE